jgi:hypothetical protein
VVQKIAEAAEAVDGGILEDDRQPDRGLEKRGEVNVTPSALSPLRPRCE